MSVAAAAPSPVVRTGKRQLDDDEGPAVYGSTAGSLDQFGAFHLVKRHKVHALQHYPHQRASPGRCGLAAESGAASQAYAHPLYLPEATVRALRALFPEMDDKTVSAVLVECGNNIDAAIKRLTDLRLSSDDATVAAATAAAASAQEPAGPILSQRADNAAAAEGATASQQQPATSGGTSAGALGPQTGEQWIDYLITEMAAATGMADARLRAARVLQSFESFTKSGAAKEADDLKAKLTAALNENAILKKAVLLQNRRLAERSASEEGELAALRQALGQYQEQLRKLELHNYSLAMHLQQATGAGGGGAVGHPPPRNPDVF